MDRKDRLVREFADYRIQQLRDPRFTRLRRKPRLSSRGGMRSGCPPKPGEGGHASAGFAEDTRGTTAVKLWGSTFYQSPAVFRSPNEIAVPAESIVERFGRMSKRLCAPKKFPRNGVEPAAPSSVAYPYYGDAQASSFQ